MKNVVNFNVIIYNTNRKVFETYDVIPYLVSCYNERRPKERPKTFEEFKEFVRSWSMYQWWGRCEYEMLLSDWPSSGVTEKWDIHKQLMMNHELVTKVLMTVLKK